MQRACGQALGTDGINCQLDATSEIATVTGYGDACDLGCPGVNDDTSCTTGCRGAGKRCIETNEPRSTAPDCYDPSTGQSAWRARCLDAQAEVSVSGDECAHAQTKEVVVELLPVS